MVIMETCVVIAVKTVLFRRGFSVRNVEAITVEIMENARKYQQLTKQAQREIDDQVSLIRRALDRAGYTHVEETEENLRSCFIDYVDAGIWSDLDPDELEGITIHDMCAALLKLR